MTNNKLERAARYYVQQEVRGMVDHAINTGDMERAFAAGAKWFEERLNSITEVEPKQKRKEIHFCESCIHFKPKNTEKDDFKELDDFGELCRLGKVLKFKMPPENDYMSYDYGFYCLGCKDYKENK